MIEPRDIVLHLQEELPQFTDYFHDAIPVTSGVVSSGTLTIVAPSHGVSAGEQVYLKDCLIRNKITGVVLTSDDTLRFTTENDHDLTAYMESRPTRNWPKGKTVDIENLQEYDLDPTPAGVPSADTFETAPGYPLPVLGGSEFLLENRSLGVNGFQVVSSVVDPNTFEIDLTANPDAPPVADQTLVIGEILTTVRVALVPDLDRAIEIYTKQNPDKMWCFVIMNDRDVSESRRNTDDMPSLPGSTLRELNIQQNFSTLILTPTNETLSGVDAININYVDIFKALLQCLYGWNKVGFNGDGIAGAYNTAYYAHSFDWWSRDRIDFEDGYKNSGNVAFRKLVFNQTIFDEGESNAEVDLQKS